MNLYHISETFPHFCYEDEKNENIFEPGENAKNTMDFSATPDIILMKICELDITRKQERENIYDRGENVINNMEIQNQKEYWEFINHKPNYLGADTDFNHIVHVGSIPEFPINILSDLEKQRSTSKMVELKIVDNLESVDTGEPVLVKKFLNSGLYSRMKVGPQSHGYYKNNFYLQIDYENLISGIYEEKHKLDFFVSYVLGKSDRYSSNLKNDYFHFYKILSNHLNFFVRDEMRKLPAPYLIENFTSFLVQYIDENVGEKFYYRLFDYVTYGKIIYSQDRMDIIRTYDSTISREFPEGFIYNFIMCIFNKIAKSRKISPVHSPNQFGLSYDILNNLSDINIMRTLDFSFWLSSYFVELTKIHNTSGEKDSDVFFKSMGEFEERLTFKLNSYLLTYYMDSNTNFIVFNTPKTNKYYTENYNQKLLKNNLTFNIDKKKYFIDKVEQNTDNFIDVYLFLILQKTIFSLFQHFTDYPNKYADLDLEYDSMIKLILDLNLKDNKKNLISSVSGIYKYISDKFQSEYEYHYANEYKFSARFHNDFNIYSKHFDPIIILFKTFENFQNSTKDVDFNFNNTYSKWLSQKKVFSDLLSGSFTFGNFIKTHGENMMSYENIFKLLDAYYYFTKMKKNICEIYGVLKKINDIVNIEKGKNDVFTNNISYLGELYKSGKFSSFLEFSKFFDTKKLDISMRDDFKDLLLFNMYGLIKRRKITLGELYYEGKFKVKNTIIRDDCIDKLNFTMFLEDSKQIGLYNEDQSRNILHTLFYVDVLLMRRLQFNTLTAIRNLSKNISDNVTYDLSSTVGFDFIWENKFVNSTEIVNPVLLISEKNRSIYIYLHNIYGYVFDTLYNNFFENIDEEKKKESLSLIYLYLERKLSLINQ